MQNFEYTAVPSPDRSEKAKGLKTGAERFAFTLTGLLNDMAADGWEYLRAETLPSEERSGLTSRTTVWNNILIFRRPVGAARAEITATREPEALPKPAEPASVVRASEPARSEPPPPQASSSVAPQAVPANAPPFSAAAPVRLDTATNPRVGPAER